MGQRNNGLGSFLTNKFGEKFLSAVNRDAFTGSGSDAIYNFHFKNIKLWETDTLYIFAGTDSGLLVRYLLKRPLPEGSRYLFLELPDVLERVREALPAELPRNILFSTPGEWVELARQNNATDYIYIERLKAYKSMAALDGHMEGYYALWTEIRRVLSMLMVEVDLETGVNMFVLREMENVAENRIPATVLRNTFPGKTAVLLAGGPSWVEILPWLRAHREQVTVMIVSRISQQLAAEGIIPDLVFSIDPYEIHFHCSKEMFDFWPQTLFINYSHVYPGLLAQWRGRTLYMGERFPWPSEHNERSFHFPGITVAHQALGVALEMGFSQVVLGGFDLCFSKDGFIYAKGSTESAVGPSVEPPELMVETNGGWMAETWYDFYHAIPSLGELAAMGLQRGCRVINPAKGAAKVPYVEHLSLDGLTPAPMEEPAHRLLQRVLPPEGRTERQAHYRMVLEELDRMRTKLQEIRALCEEAVDCNDRLFGRKGAPPDFKYKKRMDAIEEILDKEYGNHALLAKKWGIRDFLRLSRPDRERAWSDEEIEKAGRRYYEIYAKAAQDLTQFVDEARQRVRSRQEEEKDDPNYRLLMEQWLKDGHPGRMRIFLDRSAKPLPAGVTEKWRKIEEAYQAQFAGADDPAKRTWQTATTPESVRTKARMLFVEKRAEQLRLFADGLRAMTLSMEGKMETLHLLEGFSSELEGDISAAIEAYWQARHPALYMDALKQIVKLSLSREDYPTGLRALEELADRSPLHIPHYGDLLRILGDRERAVEVYASYLRVVHGDHVAMMKQGRMLLDLGRREEAVSLFREILREDVRNHAAALMLQEAGGG